MDAQRELPSSARADNEASASSSATIQHSINSRHGSVADGEVTVLSDPSLVAMELARTKSQLAEIRKTLALANEKRTGHYNKLVAVRQEAVQLKKELSAARKELAALQDSVSFAVGKAIITSTTFSAVIRLPLTLFRIYKTAKKSTSIEAVAKKHVASDSSSKLVSPSAAEDQSEPAIFRMPKIDASLAKSRKNSETKDRILIEGWPEQEENGKVTILGIMDEFTGDCFRDDVRLIQPRPDNWLPLFDKYKPELVFIESAWKGNFGSWQYRVAHYTNKPGPELQELADYARQNGVPVIFWNKEDPVHHDKFMSAAKVADVIFTTDVNMVPSYKKKTGNQFAYGLPFAAQPQLHRPAQLSRRVNSVCFAGSWYAGRHVERSETMKWLLTAAQDFPLDIYDRNFGTGVFPFPENFAKNVKGKLPYRDLCESYARYRVFLNVNSVTDSPTMFSRRVFELMASGTPVVSTYSRGIEEIFGNESIWLVRNIDEARAAIHTLMTDDVEWRRRSLTGIRQVFSNHTYRHRLQQIGDRLGLKLDGGIKPKVILYVFVKNAKQLHAVSEFAKSQSWRNFIIEVECHKSVKWVGVQDNMIKRAAGHMLAAHAVEQETGLFEGEVPLYGIISPEMLYGKDYLVDLVNASIYADYCDIWGITSGDTAFATGVPVAAVAFISRPAAFKGVVTHAARRSTLQGPNIYGVDSDQFVPRGMR